MIAQRLLLAAAAVGLVSWISASQAMGDTRCNPDWGFKDREVRENFWQMSPFGTGWIIYTITLPTEASYIGSRASSRASNSSGCGTGVRAVQELETLYFVAAMRDGLFHEMAQGGGKRVSALASLLGCDAKGLPAFDHLVQERFSVLVPEFATSPGEMLDQIKREMQSDAVLADHCTGART